MNKKTKICPKCKMELRRTYKYRLYPTRKQERLLEQILYLCHQLYNSALEQRIRAYNQSKKSLGWYDQVYELPAFKEQFPEFKQVYAWSLVDVLHRVDRAFQNFFIRLKKRNGKAGFPRFKSVNRYDSFTYSTGTVKIENKRVKLPKIGCVKIRLTRDIEGIIKTCTVKRELDRWYVCFSVIKNVDIKKRKTNREVGIDVGIKSFVTLSDGTKIENPRYLQKSEEVLKKRQRRLSRKVKGSNNRNKAKMIVAKTHRKIRDQRNDFLHKASRNIVNNYDKIYVEDLNVKGMTKNHSLAKSVMDASWSSFLSKLGYKAEEAGVLVRKIPMFYPSSKTCSVCGYINADLKLDDRQWICPECKSELDRDLNASINILQVGRGATEFKLGEVCQWTGQ